ncbi:MAG: sulfatase-like hydrolase/transferase [Hyphomonadaceae bacterium]|nr:sulfatase-like hydrolase/transferase [Hyphomonadaceae bacterium]
MENTGGKIDEIVKGFFQIRSHLFCNALILLTGFLVFLFVPFYVLTPEQAQQAFNNGRGGRVFLDILSLVGLYFAVVGTIYWIFAFTRFRQFGAFIAVFLFVWVCLSGFLFPLTTARGTEELGLAPVRMINLIIVVGVSVVIALLILSKNINIISIFFGTFLLLAIVPSMYAALSIFESRSLDDLSVPLSPEKNLIMISLDGVPGHIVTDILAEDESLREKFKDFEYFRNVNSSAPSTDAALSGVMFGNQDLTVAATLQRNDPSLLFANDANKFNFMTGFGYKQFNQTGRQISAGQFGVPEQRYELFVMYRPVFARLFSKVVVWIVDILEYELGRNAKFYTTTLGVETMTNILDNGSNKPSVYLSHFIFTHAPAMIDQRCGFNSRDTKWFDDNQNKFGVIKGSKCGLLKLADFVDKLKALGVYDNTLIVFASDHGKIVRFYDEPPHNLTINNHTSLGLDRYHPMLMVKNIGQVQDSIAYSDRLVLLDDLAKTTCLVFEKSSKCEMFKGLNLFDPNSEMPDDFFVHVAKDATSTWRVHTMKSVKLPRGVPLEQAMRASDEIKLSPPVGQ